MTTAKLTAFQQRILDRLARNSAARIRHDLALRSYELIDGAYRETLRPATFRFLEAHLEIVERVGLSRYYQAKGKGAPRKSGRRQGSTRKGIREFVATVLYGAVGLVRRRGR